ncbi:MAG TPA: methyl-accepting chemotaxis protein, partial [Cupriavidus sp.]|nr:methyl-accepting chemotaxis protein [Cupriavidus sp.]
VSDETDRTMLAADRAAVKHYRDQIPAFFERSRTGDYAGAKQMLTAGELFKASLALRKAVAEHLEYNTKQGGIA